MGVEPTWNCFAGSRRPVWLQRQIVKCPRQESNLIFDLRRVACESTTLRGQATEHGPRAWHARRALVTHRTVSAPPRSRTSSCSFEGCRANPPHSQGTSSPSRSRTWSRSLGRCCAVQNTYGPHSIPTWSRTRTWTFGGSHAIHYTIGTDSQSRRLDSHQHQPVYKTGAFLSRATSASTSARSRTPWGGFGGRLLSQEHTRVSPPATRTGGQITINSPA